MWQINADILNVLYMANWQYEIISSHHYIISLVPFQNTNHFFAVQYSMLSTKNQRYPSIFGKTRARQALSLYGYKTFGVKIGQKLRYTERKPIAWREDLATQD